MRNLKARLVLAFFMLRIPMWGYEGAIPVSNRLLKYVTNPHVGL